MESPLWRFVSPDFAQRQSARQRRALAPFAYSRSCRNPTIYKGFLKVTSRFDKSCRSPPPHDRKERSFPWPRPSRFSDCEPDTRTQSRCSTRRARRSDPPVVQSGIQCGSLSELMPLPVKNRLSIPASAFTPGSVARRSAIASSVRSGPALINASNDAR